MIHPERSAFCHISFLSQYWILPKDVSKSLLNPLIHHKAKNIVLGYQSDSNEHGEAQ